MAIRGNPLMLHPLRTKKYEEYKATAMLLGMTYVPLRHMFALPGEWGYNVAWYCAETMEPLNQKERQQRRRDFSLIESGKELKAWRGIDYEV